MPVAGVVDSGGTGYPTVKPTIDKVEVGGTEYQVVPIGCSTPAAAIPGTVVTDENDTTHVYYYSTMFAEAEVRDDEQCVVLDPTDVHFVIRTFTDDDGAVVGQLGILYDSEASGAPVTPTVSYPGQATPTVPGAAI